MEEDGLDDLRAEIGGEWHRVKGKEGKIRQLLDEADRSGGVRFDRRLDLPTDTELTRARQEAGVTASRWSAYGIWVTAVIAFAALVVSIAMCSAKESDMVTRFVIRNQETGDEVVVRGYRPGREASPHLTGEAIVHRRPLGDLEAEDGRFVGAVDGDPDAFLVDPPGAIYRFVREVD